MKQEIDQLLASHAPTFFAANELILTNIEKGIFNFRCKHGMVNVLQEHLAHYSYLQHLEAVFLNLADNQYLESLKDAMGKEQLIEAKIELAKTIHEDQALELQMEIFRINAAELWALLLGKREIDPYYIDKKEKYSYELFDIKPPVLKSLKNIIKKTAKPSNEFLLLDDAIFILGRVINYKPKMYFEHKHKYLAAS